MKQMLQSELVTQAYVVFTENLTGMMNIVYRATHLKGFAQHESGESILKMLIPLY